MLKSLNFLAWAFAFSATTLLAQNYTCIVFPLTFSSEEIFGLNNAGQFVTTVYDGSSTHGYLRQPDGTATTFDYPGATGTSARSINNRGQILGSYDTPERRNIAFLRYPDGSFQLVPQAVEDGAAANLTAMNDNQDLAGVIHATTGYLEGYEDVAVQDTSGNLLSATRMPASHDNVVTRTATALNNSRDFVAYDLSGGFFAPVSFVRYRSQLVPIFFPGVIGNYQGSDFSMYATGLNNSGVIAGRWRAGTDDYGFIHRMDGTAYPGVTCDNRDDLQTKMRPIAINDNGQIAGTTQAESGTQVFIATPTGTAPDLYLSNDSWTFSSTAVGSITGAGTIYITNRGTGMLHIVNASRSDAMLFGDNAKDFSITDSNCPPSLGINHTCSVSFTFTPSGMGNRTAHIVLADNSPTGPHIIPIQGVGAGTTLEIATTSAQFPAFPVGQMSGQIVVYPYANGDQPVQFSSISITGQNAGDFQIANNTCGTTLPPYRTCAVALTFQPSASGSRSAALVLAGDFDTSSRQIPLSGTGF